MIRLRQIKIPVLDDSPNSLYNKIIHILRVKKEDLNYYNIIRKSIDSRDKNNIMYVYEVSLNVKNEDRFLKNKNVLKMDNTIYEFPKTNKDLDRPIIIGSGPAGLFCAYRI